MSLLYGVVGVSARFRHLASCGVKFGPSFLCHLMTVFGHGVAAGGPQQSPQQRFIRDVLGSLEELHLQLSMDDYTIVVRTLLELRMFDK